MTPTARSRILFLPGASGNGSFWDPIRQRLADHPATAFDWPGLGDTPPDPAVQSYDDLVALVTDDLDTHGPAAVVGQSMGGWVAARVAVARPRLVTQLVLCATSAGLDMSALGGIDWRPGARQARPDAPEWSYAEHPSMEADLAALALPVLVISATDDPISPLAVGQRLSEVIPGSELVVYESDDHWVVREHADDVAHRIAGFLAAAP